MHGSKIAREIEEDLKREKVRKEALLQRKRRGESDGKRESYIVRGSNNG